MSSSNDTYTVDLHDVDKTYRGRVQALRGVEMQVHRGEIFGLLGPNGAGKSTLVKIMMTVVRPNRVRGTLLGRPVGDKRTLARVGYLPEHHKLPGYLTGRQAVEFYAALAAVDRSTRRRRSLELLELVGMRDWANKKISSYSKGMQQRIGIAQALMNDPELVVLDEPTDGVDPVGRREIRDMLIELRRQERTVFLNSHLLSELEMVSNRVAIMVQGRVVMQGTLEELTAHSRRYEICVAGEAPPWAAAQQGLRVTAAPQRPDEVIISTDGNDPAIIQPVIDRLRSEGRTITAIRPVRETLEDLFMRAVRDPSTGQAHLPGAARENGGAAAGAPNAGAVS